jgi:hypothetical protein
VSVFATFSSYYNWRPPGEVPEVTRHQFDKRIGGDGGDPGGPQTPHFVDTRYHGYWSLAFTAEPFRQETNIKDGCGVCLQLELK